MGLDARKPVFRVSNKARLKQISSASETSYKTEITIVASLDMIVSNKGITAPLLFANPKDRLLILRPIFRHIGHACYLLLQSVTLVFYSFSLFQLFQWKMSNFLSPFHSLHLFQ